MQTTTQVLQQMAVYATDSLHTGEQFAAMGPSLRFDVCALAFVIAEGRVPDEFFTDEITSLAIIEASAPAMAAIRAISDVLDSSVNETEVEPGTYVPDYIEHVSQWAATPGIGQTEPPTPAEIRARILRAANTLAIQTPITPAA